MSWFGSKRKSHQRLESKDANASDDSYVAVTHDWHFTEGNMQTAVGITFTSDNVITAIESSSPFHQKFKIGDTICSVNSKDTSSDGVISIMEAELTSGRPQFTLCALRKRSGTVEAGIQSEAGAWEGAL